MSLTVAADPAGDMQLFLWGARAFLVLVAAALGVTYLAVFWAVALVVIREAIRCVGNRRRVGGVHPWY